MWHNLCRSNIAYNDDVTNITVVEYKPASWPIISIQRDHKWVMKEQLTWNKCLAGEMDQSDNDLVF